MQTGPSLPTVLSSIATDILRLDMMDIIFGVLLFLIQVELSTAQIMSSSTIHCLKTAVAQFAPAVVLQLPIAAFLIPRPDSVRKTARNWMVRTCSLSIFFSALVKFFCFYFLSLIINFFSSEKKVSLFFFFSHFHFFSRVSVFGFFEIDI